MTKVNSEKKTYNLKPCLKQKEDDDESTEAGKNNDRQSSQERRKNQNFKIGPMKILIVDTDEQYAKTACLSICHSLVQVGIGAVNIAALGYTLHSGDVHGCLCTLGWHFFTAEAILALNYTNGWASPMIMRHRKLFHMILQIISLFLLVSGSVFIIILRGLPPSPHSITALIGLIMTTLTVMSGPAALLKNQNIKIFHTCLGLPSFLITSVALCLGFGTGSFQEWSGAALSYILMVIVIFYTLFILITTIIKLYMRIKYVRLL